MLTVGSSMSQVDRQTRVRGRSTSPRRRMFAHWLCVVGSTAESNETACGHVDNRRLLPTCPQAQHQQKITRSLLLPMVV